MEQAIGFAAIDRKSLEESGTLLILHYKPMKSIDDVNVDNAHAYMQELNSNPEMVELAKGCDVMVLPCHGLLADLFTMINVTAPAPEAPKASGLVNADGKPLGGGTQSIITGNDSEIPLGAQAIIAAMGGH